MPDWWRALAEPAIAPGERGAAALEFAMVAPLLFLLLFGGLELGRFLLAQAIVDHAVAAAARCHGLGLARCRTPAGAIVEADLGTRRLGGRPLPAGAIAARPAVCGLRLVADSPYPPLLLPEALLGVRLRAEACAAPLR
jgi:hypothetical protein